MPWDDRLMSTPVSLRIARLLLFAAACAALGVVIIVATRAAFFSPLLVLFLVPVALFLAAHRAMGADIRRARILALAAALALTGLGILTGFGAGDVSFPAASVGVLAAWATWLHPPRRAYVAAFLLYIAIGLALVLPRLSAVVLIPFVLGQVFIWPVTAFFLSPLLAGLPVFGALGASLAFAAYAARGPLPSPRPVLAVAVALIAGVLAVGVWFASALAQTNTSARFELAPQAVILLFAATAATTLGLESIRRLPLLAGLAIAIGSAVLAIAVISRPTVSCARDGQSTAAGPWWLGPAGTLTGSGSSDASGTTGEIRRGDGVVIRYACSGETLTEFVIERY
jgi:hypothetical protein